MQNLLVKKFLTYLYGSGVGLIVGVTTTIITTRLLSPEEFGKASMFTLAVNVLMIFIIFGTDQAFVRFFYEEKEELRSRLLIHSLRVPIILLIITIIGLLFVKDSLMLYLFEEENIFIFTVFIIGVFAQVIYRFSLLVIRMQQKAHLYSLLEISNKLLNLLLIIILYYYMGSDYKILIYSTVVTLIILTVFSIYNERNFWNFRGVGKSSVRHSQKEILSFSYPLVLTTLITWLFQAFDKIAIREWSSFEELGLYSAAIRIIGLLMMLQATFTTFWTPVCYEHYEKNPEDKSFFENTSKVIAFSMFILAIFVIMFKDFIVLLLGPEYEKAALIMPFLIFMPMMYTLSETTVIGINFFKKTKWHIIVALIACITNIIGNYILVPIYGASGAAISTGISYIIFFIMRTHISLIYYPLKYGLIRIYLIIILIGFYALQNTFWSTQSTTYVNGLILLIIIVLSYLKELIKLLDLIKSRKGGNA